MKQMRPLDEKGEITVVPVYDKGEIRQAYIDTIDAPLVSKFLWSLHSGKYVRTSSRKAPSGGYLHRVLMSPMPNEQVDHIDGNPLNNTRGNLRLVTNQQNQMARHIVTAGSRYKGVYEHGIGYRASIKFNGKQIKLGTYKTAKGAAKAYNQAAVALFGEYAVVNEVRYE